MTLKNSERDTRRERGLIIIDKDQATYDAHFKTEYFQALGKAIGDEGLLGAPLDIKTIKPIGGFVSR